MSPGRLLDASPFEPLRQFIGLDDRHQMPLGLWHLAALVRVSANMHLHELEPRHSN